MSLNHTRALRRYVTEKIKRHKDPAYRKQQDEMWALLKEAIFSPVQLNPNEVIVLDLVEMPGWRKKLDDMRAERRLEFEKRYTLVYRPVTTINPGV